MRSRSFLCVALLLIESRDSIRVPDNFPPKPDLSPFEHSADCYDWFWQILLRKSVAVRCEA
jgi:hypothetical protein